MALEVQELDPMLYARLAEVAEGFNDESWRGRVLMAAGLIEEMLKDVIAGLMVEGAPQKKLFEGERAPLASLGARSCVAQSLGLISSEELRDLEIIRKVRNKFAHEPNASFERDDIRDSCMELTLYRHGDEMNVHDPAHRFMGSAMILMVALPLRAETTKERKLAARPNDTHWWK